jgi:hypothetical protein
MSSDNICLAFFLAVRYTVAKEYDMIAHAQVKPPQGITLEDLWTVLMELRRQVQALQESHHAPIPVPETVILDSKTAAMEMNRIRKVVEESGIHTPSHDVEGVLEELIRQAKTETQCKEYRRMLDILPAIDAARERERPESIKAWLKQREEDWADPWEEVKQKRLRQKYAESRETALFVAEPETRYD